MATSSKDTKIMKNIVKFFSLFVILLQVTESSAKTDNGTLPIVLWHGMGDSCCNPLSMGAIKSLLEDQLSNVYVRSLMVGNNVIGDTTNGFFLNANYQVKEVCDKIAADPKLKSGYNAT